MACANEPVHMTDAGNVQPFWAITKHRHITEISSQPDVFSSASGQHHPVPQGPDGRHRRRVEPLQSDAGDHLDGPARPSHVPQGRQRILHAAGITRLDEIVTDTATLMMDRLAEHGDEPVDFVELVAQRHPLRVLCTILGVPEPTRIACLNSPRSCSPSTIPTSAPRRGSGRRLGGTGHGVLHHVQHDHRGPAGQPRDDLASLLANATLENGEPMGLVETLGYYLIVFNAGHDTPATRSPGDGGVPRPPRGVRSTQGRPSLIKTAVEEIVRWTAPVNYMKRTALRDYQLDDTLIREGEAVAMFYGAANRDEEVFDDPDRFDVGRTPNRHLGFGWAEHYCLGAHLAKASIAALLEQMVERIDSIEPAGDRSVVSASFVHGYKHLPVRVNWSS